MSRTSAVAARTQAVSPVLSAGAGTTGTTGPDGPMACPTASCAWAIPANIPRPRARTIPRLNARRYLAFMVAPPPLCPRLSKDPAGPSERRFAALAGADADDLVQRSHEDLPIAELPGPRHLHDRVDRRLDQLVGQGGLDPDLGQQVHPVLAAPVGLGVPFLSAEAPDLVHRHAHHPDLLQRGLHVLQEMRADDAFDLLHWASLHRFLPMSAPGHPGGYGKCRTLDFSTALVHRRHEGPENQHQARYVGPQHEGHR